MIGRTISDYQIMEKIGEGDKSIVYKALDLHPGHESNYVTLKVFDLQNTGENSKDQYLQTLQLTSGLMHQNIYPIYEISETREGELFVCMPYYEGMTLKKRIYSGPLRIRTAVAVALKVAQTLAEAHKRRIYHLNLKSSNILITTKGEIKIMDFGLSGLANAVNPTRSRNGKAVYATAYLSPEQLAGQPADHRSDIWSLGVIFYEMLTGQPPFDGVDQMELKQSIVRRNPQPIVNLFSTSPEKVQRFFEKTLAKDPAGRYQSMPEFVSNLKTIAVTLAPGQEKSTPITIHTPKLSPRENGENGAKTRPQNAWNQYVKETEEKEEILFGQNSLYEKIEPGALETPVIEEKEEILFEQNNLFEKTEPGALETPVIKTSYDDAITTEAQSIYLEGLSYLDRWTVEDLKTGKEHFLKAIEKDSHYAPAYAGLATIYNILGIYGAYSPKSVMPKARQEARRALEINGLLPEALIAMGSEMAAYEWDWKEAEEHFKLGIDLKPDYVTGHHWYAINFLTPRGRFEEAIEEIKTAFQLEPTSLVIEATVGLQYYYARQYDRAIEHFRKILQKVPNFAIVNFFMGQVYAQKNMYDEALLQFQETLKLFGDNTNVLATFGHIIALTGRKDISLKVLDQLLESSREKYVSAYDIAIICTGLGDKDRAFEWLEEAIAEKAYSLIYLNVDPLLDELREDIRFKMLLQQVGIEA